MFPRKEREPTGLYIWGGGRETGLFEESGSAHVGAARSEVCKAAQHVRTQGSLDIANVSAKASADRLPSFGPSTD